MSRPLCLVLLQAAALASPGCASVPEEAVTLSMRVGDDLESVRLSYAQVLRDYFELLRDDARRTFDEKFTPAYLAKFIADADLVGFARQAGDSDRAKAAVGLEAVEFWARTAVTTLDATRTATLKPIDEAERALLLRVDAVFGRIAAANAAVTAHLNSVNRVQAAQDRALDAVGLKEARDRLNEGLVEASRTAASIGERIEAAGGQADLLLGPSKPTDR